MRIDSPETEEFRVQLEEIYDDIGSSSHEDTEHEVWCLKLNFFNCDENYK